MFDGMENCPTPHGRKAPTMIRSFSIAIVALFLGGCATAAEMRAEMISVGPIDEPWVIRVQAIAQGETCGLGFGGLELMNNGKTPLGGSFLATVTDSSKAKTIGEFTVVCQTAPAGGTAPCSSAQPLTFPCQFTHIQVKPLTSPR